MTQLTAVIRRNPIDNRRQLADEAIRRYQAGETMAGYDILRFAREGLYNSVATQFFLDTLILNEVYPEGTKIEECI